VLNRRLSPSFFFLLSYFPPQKTAFSFEAVCLSLCVGEGESRRVVDVLARRDAFEDLGYAEDPRLVIPMESLYRKISSLVWCFGTVRLPLRLILKKRTWVFGSAVSVWDLLVTLSRRVSLPDFLSREATCGLSWRLCFLSTDLIRLLSNTTHFFL